MESPTNSSLETARVPSVLMFIVAVRSPPNAATSRFPVALSEPEPLAKARDAGALHEPVSAKL